jgi:hypothetical protein
MPRSINPVVLLILVVIGHSTSACCQDKSGKSFEYSDADDGGIYANVFVGGGTGLLLGGSAGFYMTRSLVDHRRFGGGGFVEYAVLNPSKTSSANDFFSADYQETLKIRKPPAVPHRAIFPFATVGYTHLIGSSNGVNFGGGLIAHYTKKTELVPALRIEYRDYYLPEQGHNQTIRLAWQIDFNTP